MAGYYSATQQHKRRRSTGRLSHRRLQVRLLRLFLQHPGRVFSRDEITQMLRGHEWSPLDRMIDGHVSRLRRKIDIPGKDETSFIKSVRGVGYAFAGEVKHV